jgi:putative endonuclease
MSGETHTVSDHDPPAWVYLLRCRDGSLYTGWTSDLDRRVARHQAGTGSRYTASRLPVALALAIPMADRTAARREEARIKQLTRAGKLALIAAQAAAAARSDARAATISGTEESGSSSPASRATAAARR